MSTVEHHLKKVSRKHGDALKVRWSKKAKHLIADIVEDILEERIKAAMAVSGKDSVRLENLSQVAAGEL